jgi:carboxymethylenebutenolidase
MMSEEEHVIQNRLDLHEEFALGRLGRREFMRRFALFAGGTAALPSLSSLLEGRHLSGQTVAKDDPRLVVENIVYQGETGEVKAHFARPKGEGKWPGVVVIHENRGLNPHIEDVTRRVAAEGYLAIGPDALSPLGGTPSDPKEATPLFQKLDRQANTKNFTAAVQYLKTHPLSTGKVGCMGFCWGGGVTNQVAVNSPDLSAAVPFYGAQPAAEDVPKIKAAMLIHYAGDDARINAGIPAFEEALKKAGIEYKIFMYEGAGHAFFNDTNESRYNKEAAELAWRRTLAFFKEKLKA